MNTSRSLLSGFACVVLALVVAPTKAVGPPPAAEPSRWITVPEFRGKPWKWVFQWLTEQTGKPLVSNYMPTCSFTFVPPNPPRKYTLPEVIDLINDRLLLLSTTQQYILLQRPRNFILVPADDTEEYRIPLTELKQRGRTELVSVVFRCKSLNALDIEAEVKQQMSAFGDAVAWAPRGLILRDTAGNLRRVCRMLRQLDK
jgi:hypothetical protein